MIPMAGAPITSIVNNMAAVCCDSTDNEMQTRPVDLVLSYVDISIQEQPESVQLRETQEDIPATTKLAPNIQAIDKASVHKICSGQVVLTLATAVKELVENSVDAGATIIEIKLREYGSESIEVSDNGQGVEEMNFEGLTLKHHTSKLQDFEDLVNVSTFGFRGEALSSLCALSNMVIVTRHQTVAVGTKLEFDLNGRIVSRKTVPRQVGTTVHIQNIFHTLPVRHKEFQRNVKKEFAKLVQVLNAYCIINTGVRISCFNQTGKGSRTSIVATNGNESIRDNISNVFGAKQLSSLLEFCQSEAKDDICEDFGIKPQQRPGVKFQIQGFVSKCEHGQGRGTTDRQFIFINKRPCDSSKIVKLVNEVYHGYNRHQYPFIVLSISVDKESVDVNVTPDKRQIFLEGEPFLLAVIKASLIQMYEPTSSVYKVNNILSPANFGNSERGDNPSHSFTFGNKIKEEHELASDLSYSVAKLKRSFSSAFTRNSPVTPVSPVKKAKNASPSFISNKSMSQTPQDKSSITHFFRKSVKTTTSSNNETIDSNKSVSNTDESVQLTSLQDDVFETGHIVSSDSRVSFPVDRTVCEGDHAVCDGPSTDNVCDIEAVTKLHSVSMSLSSQTMLTSHRSPGIDTSPIPGTSVSDNRFKITFHTHSSERNSGESFNCSSFQTPEKDQHNNEERRHSQAPHYEPQYQPSNLQTESQVELDLPQETSERKPLEKIIPFSMAKLKENMAALSLNVSNKNSSFSRCFRAKINPADNSSAEDELKRAISKDMFIKMEILGQFNLGFIIAKLDSDLFIIDQHATDEKYNFEMLQRNTVLQSQKLISPQTIELTASNEAILVDNLEVFKKNGFDFIVNEEALPTQRVKLVSTPVSKNWIFGKDDIEELIFMLTDSPNVMCRPTRVRMMFASRACRKSVMIGTALSQSEMRRLVNHMGELDQPWNCPHGRPTMRHLFNLDMLPS
ncbi:mismatch repair endonuclease PMS2 [Biomphalaria glabrata]